MQTNSTNSDNQTLVLTLIQEGLIIVTADSFVGRIRPMEGKASFCRINGVKGADFDGYIRKIRFKRYSLLA